MNLDNYDIIGVCGYGNSGASAVMDLLKGSSNLYVENKREWQFLHKVDGIFDLEYYLVDCRDKIASNTAIKRFENGLNDFRYWILQKENRDIYYQESKKYINRLKKCSWIGYSAMDAGDVLGFDGTKWGYFLCLAVNKLIEKNKFDTPFPPARERYFSLMSKEEFVAITKDYLSALFEKCICEQTGELEPKPIVLEQLFVFSNPTKGHEYFKSAKTILVERDPRDVFASSRFSCSTGAPASLCRFMPVGTVDQFVEYYKRLHIGVEESENVLIVHFEDLIYNYDKTAKQLCSFCGIEMTNELKKYFHKEISILNTAFYKRCPQIADEIDYIEKQLPEYLNHYVN